MASILCKEVLYFKTKSLPVLFLFIVFLRLFIWPPDLIAVFSVSSYSVDSCIPGLLYHPVLFYTETFQSGDYNFRSLKVLCDCSLDSLSPWLLSSVSTCAGVSPVFRGPPICLCLPENFVALCSWAALVSDLTPSLSVFLSLLTDKSHSKLHGPGWAMITRSVLLAVSWVYSWLSGNPQTPPLSLSWAEGGLNFKAVTHLVNLRTSYTLSHQVEWLAGRRGKWQRCPEYRPLSLIFTPDFSGI